MTTDKPTFPTNYTGMAEACSNHISAMKYIDMAEELIRREPNKLPSNNDLMMICRWQKSALQCEQSAIKAMGANRIEPTWSILHRSAATLALECSEYELARELVQAGLSGQTPPEIKKEMDDILYDVEGNLEESDEL